MNSDTERFVAPQSAHGPMLARQRIAAWLAVRECPPELCEDVLLIVSELVTNAIVHAGSAATVVASQSDGAIRVEVHDHGTDAPMVRDRDRGPGGLGLRLVASLADAWGWEPNDDGKLVWAVRRR